MKNPLTTSSENLPLIPSNACSGDACESIEPWPVHHIRHRNNNNNNFLRLCSSCVLKYHPGSFCSSCFELLDSLERPPLVHCSKCSSVSHLSCLKDPSLSSLYLCPACDSPSPTSFSYFPYSKFSGDRVIDLRAAKILLSAARLSAGSMNRAAAIARVEAEKKVKEAALARKRARDMLDRSLVVCEKEKGRIKESVGTGVRPVVGTEPKRKACRPAVSVQKRVQEREREKWKRFSEPIGLANRPAILVGGNEKIKGLLNSDGRDGCLIKDEEKKGIVVSGEMTEIGKQE